MASQQTLVMHRPEDMNDLGPQRMDIHLFSTTIDHGGHSVRATLPVLQSDGLVRQPFTHPVHFLTPVTLLPGVIEVETVQKSHVNVMCLGGTGTFEEDTDVSTCKLVSTAPFIVMSKSLIDADMDPVSLFNTELEAWLSVLRVRARQGTDQFYARLARIPPLTLYAQGLLLAARQLGSVPVDERSDRFWRSYNVIQNALAAAKHRPDWPNPMPSLESELTQPSSA